jgi:hypothetical protein
LNRISQEKIQKYFDHLKKHLELIDFKENLPPLDLDYQEFKKELYKKIEIKVKTDNRKEEPSEKEKMKKNTIDKKIQTQITDYGNIDEFSDKDDKESEESVKEDDIEGSSINTEGATV